MKLAAILIIGLLLLTMVGCATHTESNSNEKLTDSKLNADADNSFGDELMKDSDSVEIGDMI